MNEEDVLKEAMEIDIALPDEEEKRKSKTPFIVIGVFLALIIVLYVVPYYGIQLNPEPRNIPSRADALAPGIEQALEPKKDIKSMEQVRELINPVDQHVKLTADKIASASCSHSDICYAKAMYYFIRDNFQYIPDPINVEYIEDPKEFFVAGGGDCESGSIALAALEESVGIDSQLVHIAGHMYVRINVPDAPRTYKNDGWIYLDWTCKDCEFGQIPWYNWKKEASYLEVP